MVLTSSIQYALESLKDEIKELQNSKSKRLTYDVEPLISAAKKIVLLVEDNGLPEIDIEMQKNTDIVKSEYINGLSSQVRNLVLLLSRQLDELTVNLNEVLIEYKNEYDVLSIAIEKLKINIQDLENQVIAKVTNKSIYDHEVKNIDFEKTVRISTADVVNNIITLPIIKSENIFPSDYIINMNSPTSASNKMGTTLIATEDKFDYELLNGSYFGNLVGKLDGTEDFISQDDFSLKNIYSLDLNKSLISNLYSSLDNETYSFTLDNKFNRTTFNFISVKSNADIGMSLTKDNETYSIKPYNNTFVGLQENIDSIKIKLTQDKAAKLKYHGIDIYRGNNLSKRLNYFCSLGHKFPEILKKLNPDIKYTDVTIDAQERIVESLREGYFKYTIDLNSVQLKFNTYMLSGFWESALIETTNPIYSIDLSSDSYIPDDAIDYIKYKVSVDGSNWYEIVPDNFGINSFTVNKKKRLVLSNENNNDKFMFINDTTKRYGFFLRVELTGNTSKDSPAIYNLRVRVKVDTNE